MGDYVSVVGSCPEYLDSITGTGCMHDDPPGSEPHEFSWQGNFLFAAHGTQFNYLCRLIVTSGNLKGVLLC